MVGSRRRRGNAAGALLAGAGLALGMLTIAPVQATPSETGTETGTETRAVTGPHHGHRYSAEIRRTSYGVPHIRAKNYGSLGFGTGYVQAEDNVCVIAETVVTANGTRSRDLETTPVNVQSDLFYGNVVASRAVEKVLRGRRDGVHAPSREARALVRGFVAGYNKYVRTERTTDPACRDAPWVRPISELEYWRTTYASLIRAGSRALLGGILVAEPPAAPSGQGRAGALTPRALGQALEDTTAVVTAPDGASAGIGSNAYGLGDAATRGRGGMVLGNPHFPWDGAERFYRLHQTIPGEYDVEGASLLGSPMVQIGHNRSLAWSHTVSTARRFVWHRLTLVPGDPTSYLFDGKPTKMTQRTVTVADLSKTFYETRFGPIVVVPGQFDWTATTAYAITDINATNARAVDGWVAMGQATTVRKLERALARYQHLPWVNVIAADSRGEALYADHSVVPRVTAELAQKCIALPLQPLYATTGMAVLDGSTSACDLGRDPDAAVAGVLGPRNLPIRFRDDYVTNSNDSHWLANPDQPLTGFPRIIGDEGTARTLRTRLGLLMVQQRLAGTDDLPRRRFDPRLLWRTMFNNRVYGGELVRDDLVAACGAVPIVRATSGEDVDLTAACDVLAGWDLRADLASTGTHVFREFVLAGGLRWADSFDPADPVNTPRVLATGDPAVLRALADAVQKLAGISLDAPLGRVQTEPRSDHRIPIHGDRGDTGAFNVITAALVPGVGYPEVLHGTSYVMAVKLGPHGPRGRQLLTYSQSSNPNSPYSADQTRLYSRKGWDTVKFTDAQINRDPNLVRYVVRGKRR